MQRAGAHFSRLEEFVAEPSGEPTCAVLVLSGSSGRVESDRVKLLADHGAVALSIRWFGGPGQPPGICEVPLETFTPALDRLAERHHRLAVIGTSKGTEAALLLAARDTRIQAVAALSPSSVVWANVGAGLDGFVAPYRSSWTSNGSPLAFVPYDETWKPTGDPPSYHGLYTCSLKIFPAAAQAAVIPVEQITGEVLVSAGTDDQVWPSERFATEIRTRRANAGLTTRLLIEPGAGHRVRLPGEPMVVAGTTMARGGEEAADAALGTAIWRELEQMLRLRSDVNPGRS